MTREKKIETLISLVLGDGCILNRNDIFYISINHGEKQKDYLEWKARLVDETKLFVSSTKIKSKITYLKETNKNYLQYYFCKTSKELKNLNLYNILYQDKKKSIHNALKYIKSDKSLAIWFMDDGSVFKRKKKHKSGDIYFLKPALKLCTHSFTYEENLEIIDWFKRKYLIDAKLVSETKRYKKYYYLRFNSEESYKIYRIIKKYIIQIESMRNKFIFFEEYYYNN